MNTLADLFAAVHAAVAENWPSRLPVSIAIYLHDAQQPISLPVPAATRPSAALDAVFIPNAFQAAILEALEGKALKTGALATAVHCDSPQLFKKPRGGMSELREEGLVNHHPRLGYYRPDAPPPELAESSDE